MSGKHYLYLEHVPPQLDGLAIGMVGHSFQAVQTGALQFHPTAELTRTRIQVRSKVTQHRLRSCRHAQGHLAPAACPMPFARGKVPAGGKSTARVDVAAAGIPWADPDGSSSG